MVASGASLKLNSNSNRRVRRGIAATALLGALVVSGCGALLPATERTEYRERADAMHQMNRPNVTGENPDTELSESIWWFY